MDTATGDIRAVEFTSSRQGDSPFVGETIPRIVSCPSSLPELLSQIPAGEEIETVTADGAYDTRRCHAAILGHGAEPIIPIRRHGRAWKPDCPAATSRKETLRATRFPGRSIWKKWTGYHARSRVEARMNRLKLFGERIMSRDPDRQTAEIQIRIAIMTAARPLDGPRSKPWHETDGIRGRSACHPISATRSSKCVIVSWAR